jgi:hypothetical protein
MQLELGPKLSLKLSRAAVASRVKDEREYAMSIIRFVVENAAFLADTCRIAQASVPDVSLVALADAEGIFRSITKQPTDEDYDACQ